MKKTRYTESQVIKALKEVEGGRKINISPGYGLTTIVAL